MSVLFKADLWSSDYVQRKQLSIKIRNFTAANLTERQRNMKWTFSLIINNKVNYWIKQREIAVSKSKETAWKS